MATYGHDMNRDLEQIHNTIDLCQGSGLTVLENSLAGALTDALEFISAINSPDSNLRQQVIRRLQENLPNTLSNLQNKLKLYKEKELFKEKEKFETLCEKVALCLKDLNSYNLSWDDFIAVDPRLLEEDSRRLLETAHKAMDLLEQHKTGEEEIDYTPGVICLGKAFEREINLSVVNWMRKLCGVELPKYFNQYQPNLVLERDFLDLNKEPWRPPDFSKSERIYRKVALNSMPDNEMSLDKENRKLLRRCWGQIRKQRNNAAHYSIRSPIIKQQDFNEVKDALVELANNNVFDVFSDMKKKYSECEFSDKLRPVISTAIEEKHEIKKKHGDPITVTEMKTLTKIDGRDKDIYNLAGLEVATELGELDLGRNVIEDLSPLQELTNLQTLKLNNNKITDLTPLKELINLKILWLNNNKITDLTPLKELINLKILWLNNNIIMDISPLKCLNNLTYLKLDDHIIVDRSKLPNNLVVESVEKYSECELSDKLRPVISMAIEEKHKIKKKHGDPITVTEMKILTKIDGRDKDICNLAGLEIATELGELDLGRNAIEGLSPLKELTKLKTLKLNNNKITNLEPLKELINLRTLWLNNNKITNLEPLQEIVTELGELDLGRNAIEGLSPLKELTKLKTLKLNNNKITNLEPLKELINLQTLWLNDNKITNLEPLKELINLRTLWLNNNKITNLEPLKELINLQTLRLDNNNIVDISPLRCLNNLAYLKLDGGTLPNNLEYLILGDKRILPSPS